MPIERGTALDNQVEPSEMKHMVQMKCACPGHHTCEERRTRGHEERQKSPELT